MSLNKGNWNGQWNMFSKETTESTGSGAPFHPPFFRNPQAGLRHNVPPPPFANNRFSVESRFPDYHPLSLPQHSFAVPNQAVPGSTNQFPHPPHHVHLRGAAPSPELALGVNYSVPPPPPPSSLGQPSAMNQYQQSNYPPFSQIPPPSIPIAQHPQLGNFSGRFQSAQNGEKSWKNSKGDTPDCGLEEKNGVVLLDKWLQKAGKSKFQQRKANTEVKPSVNLQLCNAVHHLKDITELLLTMSTQVAEMTSTVSSADSVVWENMKKNIDSMKEKYTAHNFFWEESTTAPVERKLTKSRQKRARLKQSRKTRYEERQKLHQMWEEKSQAIDKWQESHQAKIREENLRKSRKAAADKTLSKVSKEIQDATRLIETMLALQKLRLIRRDAAQKRGDSDLGESRQAFEQKITDMTRLVQAQLDCYKEEEAKLKQIIKSEQEESSRKERQVQVEKDTQRLKEEDEDLYAMLFGPPDDPSPEDPLYPFAQYYKQAESSIQSFIQIRHEWDSFVVAENTPASSAIPPSWIVPDPPSSAAWASALQ